VKLREIEKNGRGAWIGGKETRDHMLQKGKLEGR